MTVLRFFTTIIQKPLQFIAGSLTIFCLTSAVAYCQCQDARVREHNLRRRVTKLGLPTFPEEAKRTKTTGVAVAAISIDEEGRLKSIEVLQAPHPSIAKAMSDAIRQWVFEVKWSENEPKLCLRGKITFYFRIERGEAVVKTPKRLSI